MADFCNTCIAKMALAEQQVDYSSRPRPEWLNNYPDAPWPPEKDTRTIEEIYATIDPDIDVFAIFNKLPPDHWQNIGICEGCGLCAVSRNMDGELKVAYYPFGAKPDDLLKWVDYPDLRKKND